MTAASVLVYEESATYSFYITQGELKASVEKRGGIWRDAGEFTVPSYSFRVRAANRDAQPSLGSVCPPAHSGACLPRAHSQQQDRHRDHGRHHPRAQQEERRHVERDQEGQGHRQGESPRAGSVGPGARARETDSATCWLRTPRSARASAAAMTVLCR